MYLSAVMEMHKDFKLMLSTRHTTILILCKSGVEY